MVLGMGVLDQFQCTEVYNALDTGNNQFALRKADEILSKRRMPLASALRSIALVRLDDDDEARCEVERLMQSNIDTTVLHLLSYVMPHLGMLPKLAELYMAASNAKPGDAKLAEEALLTAVKASTFQRASLMLMKEYRAKKNTKSFWRYMEAATLQSQQLAPPSSILALQVAHRLLTEFAPADTSFTEETLELYLRFHILLGKDQLAVALAMMDKPYTKQLAEKSLGIQFLLRRAWEMHGDLDRILDDCGTRIEKGDRNWAVISLYIRTLMNQSEKEGQSRLTADEVAPLVHAVDKDTWTDRGSFLGILETFRLANDKHISVEALDSLGYSYTELVQKYLARFGDKASCFDELRPYLATLTPEQYITLLESLQATTPASNDTIFRCVNDEKIKFLQSNRSEDVPATCKRLFSEYHQAMAALRLPDTEMQLADDFALLAVYTVLISAPTMDTETLVNAYCITSYSLLRSPRAYKLRIVGIRLLLQLGCAALAMEQMQDLRLKAIQLETASHVALDRNTAFGGEFAGLVKEHWDTVMRPFYKTSAQEIPNVVGEAFVNGKFAQVGELFEFGERIRKSLFCAMQEVDLVRASIIEQQVVTDKTMKTVSALCALAKEGPFHDQRDMALVPNYSPSTWPNLERALTCGPIRNTNWILCMLEVITLACNLPSHMAGTESEMTPAEIALVLLARALRKEDAQDSTALVAFLGKIGKLVADAENYFQLLHGAWIGLEGVRLVELWKKHHKLDSLFMDIDEALQPITETLAKAESEPTVPKAEVFFEEMGMDNVFVTNTTQTLCQVEEARVASIREVLQRYKIIART
ncbi:mitochondrial distribution and morphology [Malassezia vespertilionis]|uniref:mitochondrial distribution and morphology n=1 Tax=Malassezia vespertilionis TaxID=2020962 RepID=UPI0024B13718|nr:mitochondrial distribution and morphology [Malassezia vespertilionis]WFD07963.1 mitochondrial distribution and morphology [Malassezia vespertilionis]